MSRLLRRRNWTATISAILAMLPITVDAARGISLYFSEDELALSDQGSTHLHTRRRTNMPTFVRSPPTDEEGAHAGLSREDPYVAPILQTHGLVAASSCPEA